MFHLDHLNHLRLAELDLLLEHLPRHSPARLLEVGAGTGRQGLELRTLGYKVELIDLASSSYANDRLCEVTDYDGRTIPFQDSTFDVVYSSNVLEHVPDLATLHAEIRRVLRPSGYAIHLVPTHHWRIWSSISAFPAAAQRAYSLRRNLLPRRVSRAGAADAIAAWMALARCIGSPFAQRRHGERGNVLTEVLLFRPAWWRRNFLENGFEILHERPAELFYTGSMVMGPRLSIQRRRQLALALGSACQLFVVRPKPLVRGAAETG